MSSAKIWKDRECKQCGTRFDTGDIRKWFCCNECKVKHFNAKRKTTKEVERNCVVCGKSFKPQQNRGVGRSYCSEECKKILRSSYKPEKKVLEVKLLEGKRWRREYMRKWIKSNGGYKAMDLKRKFGITLEEFEVMKAQQHNCCAICGKPETAAQFGKVRDLAIDHNHVTGKVRALLCTKCNQGIGSFLDDISLLEKAINYLKKHEV